MRRAPQLKVVGRPRLASCKVDDTGSSSTAAFGECIPTDVVYHDGSDPVRMHNYYPLLYNRCVFEVLEECLAEGEDGKGQACVFARSATAGVPAPDGSVAMTVEVRRSGAQIEVSVQGATPMGGRQPWSLLLRGIETVASVTGGIAEKDSLGTRILPDQDDQNVVIHL